MAAILGVSGWVGHRYRRIEQIRYLRRFLRHGRADLQSMSLLADSVKWMQWKKLHDEIAAVLNARCPDMSFGQIYAIRSALQLHGMFQAAGVPVSVDTFCRDIYAALGRHRFLRAPPWDEES